MRSTITFLLDGRVRTIDFAVEGAPSPTTTVLNWLRSLPDRKGVKEGCAEGDCGACTIVLGEAVPPALEGTMRYRALDSCLVFLPMLDGLELVTVESLRAADGALHPVQEAMVDADGSQCGYCTPGFIMSMFALYHSGHADHALFAGDIAGGDGGNGHAGGGSSPAFRAEIDDALTGNLCRCTGYRPIVEAAARSCASRAAAAGRQTGGVSAAPADHFTSRARETAKLLASFPATSLDIRTSRGRYRRPASLAEAVAILHQSPQALVVAGGTDVALRVTKRHELLADVVDISRITELKEINETSAGLTVGGGASLSSLHPAARRSLPALASMLDVFGSRQIRNVATLGGNLGTASPIGDTLPVLMAYGARVRLESLDGRRELPIDGFFTGYRKTLRRPAELITHVVIPRPPAASHIRSYKISKRKDLDISTVSAGFRVDLERDGTVAGIVLAYGGMAERPKRAEAAERALRGKRWTRDNVAAAAKLLDGEFTPISDARAGAAMRRIAARNLLLKFHSDTAGENK